MGVYRFIACGGENPIYGYQPILSIRVGKFGLQVKILSYGGVATWINAREEDIIQ